MNNMMINNNNATVNFEYTKAFTHGGCFHADDVFATALLLLINKDLQIERGFKVPEDYEGIVYDIGGGKFDHHQADHEIRENGVPYAAFGLLWREFGEFFGSPKVVEEVDKTLVQSIDSADNGVEGNLLSSVISHFNPNWNEDIQSDTAFKQAVSIAQIILIKSVRSAASKFAAEELVIRAMEESDGNILVLPKFAPWQSYVMGSEYKYVVFPSNRGGYNVQGVPVEEGSFELVKPLPESWRGKPADQLPELTGVKDCTFVHPTGFLASCSTKEGALALAKKALEY